MKNPMTPEEQCQAVMDNAAGHNMQYRLFNLVDPTWNDRTPEYAGTTLDFINCEYRRKPELMECFLNVYEKANPVAHTSLENSIKFTSHGFVKRVRLVEDPTWVEPEPAIPPMPPKSPWRPIIKGEWPECKPEDVIRLENAAGHEWSNHAGNLAWKNPHAIKWRYAEDE